MIKTIFKNLVYTYYPKGVCDMNESEKYLNSAEYINLSNVINNFINNEEANNNYKMLFHELKNYSFSHNIQDVTLLNWKDRCLSFEIDKVEENILYKICIHISLLIPYYSIYILKNKVQFNPYKYLSSPKRNKSSEVKKFKKDLEKISSIIHKCTYFNKFPEDFIHEIIPDVSFQNNRMGGFTFFNAFFLDDNKH